MSGNKQEELRPELIDRDAVATVLSCSPRHVVRLSDSGQMPASVRIGALVRWSRKAIEEWIAEGCPAARKNPERAGGRALYTTNRGQQP